MAARMAQPPENLLGMSRDDIITVLENIARLLELKGENPFKVRAYTNAARALETVSEPLEKLVEEDRLGEVDGLGKATSEKIATLVREGKLDYYDHLSEEFPPDILSLFELQGLGAKKIKVLWDSLQVHSITKLERADGSSMTINVEYNQLEPMLKASGYPEGDVNAADGFSIFPGNINQLVFAIAPYCAVLKQTGGLVPEFVNPKYADAAKNRFKKPTRLECMMQVRPGGQEGRRAALGGGTPPHTHSRRSALSLSRTRTRTRAPRARPAGPAQGLSLQRQGGCLHV
jgi:hypothetical protein